MNLSIKKEQKAKTANTSDIFNVLREMQLRENKLARAREHLWVVSLAQNNFILNIDLVTLGSLYRTAVGPGDVLTYPVQKRAAKIILVHSRPSGDLHPTEAEMDFVDFMFQCAKLYEIPLADYLIISDDEHISFAEAGLLNELELSTRYPMRMLEEMMKKKKLEGELEREKAKDIARELKKAKVDEKIIETATGLSRAEIKRLK